MERWERLLESERQLLFCFTYLDPCRRVSVCGVAGQLLWWGRGEGGGDRSRGKGWFEGEPASRLGVLVSFGDIALFLCCC